MVEEEEPGQVEVSLSNILPHQERVCLVLQDGFCWQDGIGIIRVHDDGVHYVEPTEIVPNILCRLHGKMGQTIQDLFVRRVNG